jgi:hypothetical protein
MQKEMANKRERKSFRIKDLRKVCCSLCIKKLFPKTSINLETKEYYSLNERYPDGRLKVYIKRPLLETVLCNKCSKKILSDDFIPPSCQKKIAEAERLIYQEYMSLSEAGEELGGIKGERVRQLLEGLKYPPVKDIEYQKNKAIHDWEKKYGIKFTDKNLNGFILDSLRNNVNFIKLKQEFPKILYPYLEEAITQSGIPRAIFRSKLRRKIFIKAYDENIGIKEYLDYLYNEKNMGLQEMAEMFDAYGPSHLQRYMSSLGIMKDKDLLRKKRQQQALKAVEARRCHNVAPASI